MSTHLDLFDQGYTPCPWTSLKIHLEQHKVIRLLAVLYYGITKSFNKLWNGFFDVESSATLLGACGIQCFLVSNSFWSTVMSMLQTFLHLNNLYQNLYWFLLVSVPWKLVCLRVLLQVILAMISFRILQSHGSVYFLSFLKEVSSMFDVLLLA